MSFLAPLFLYAGLGVALGAVGLHFIVTRQPTSSPLPTARFVPPGTVRVTTVSRPRDLLLLLLRVATIVLAAAAFARPVLVPPRRPVLHVVLADVSRGVARIDEVRDSARAVLRPGDVLVVFDTTARAIRTDARDSAATIRRSGAEARLSPALVAALRSASELRSAADSFELVIVSPLRAGLADGATSAIRRLWPGRARLVRVAASRDSVARDQGVTIRVGAGDPIAAGVTAAQLRAGATVRLVRGTPSAADSAWAVSGRHTLVRWPASDAPAGWTPRPRPDTVNAVASGEVVLVAPLVRRVRPPSAIAGRVVARWVDGEPAAVERVAGEGCVRDVAVELPARGDLAMRPAFGDLLRALTAPCAGAVDQGALDPAAIAAIEAPGRLAAAQAFRPADRRSTPLVPWLLGGALLLALVEPFVRRRGARAGDGTPEAAGAAARAA